jgi:glycosyltransferase involved in cell wall biosynthesis
VASQLGQIGEVLVEGETALLVQPGDVRELKEALVRLVDDKGMRRSLGVKAREVAEREHTWRHNAERVLQAYKTLTGLQD